MQHGGHAIPWLGSRRPGLAGPPARSRPEADSVGPALTRAGPPVHGGPEPGTWRPGPVGAAGQCHPNQAAHTRTLARGRPFTGQSVRHTHTHARTHPRKRARTRGPGSAICLFPSMCVCAPWSAVCVSARTRAPVHAQARAIEAAQRRRKGDVKKTAGPGRHPHDPPHVSGPACPLGKPPPHPARQGLACPSRLKGGAGGGR